MRFINRLFRRGTELVIAAILLIAIAFIITSCGVVGGLTAGGGVSGTGIATGIITAFGSVFVNGVEFKTTSAEIIVNGSSASENDLKIGMKVTVEAAKDVALSIAYGSEVKGQVSNKGVNSFDVLGQTVAVNSDTRYCFNDERTNCTFSFADLNVGDFVEVSGFSDANGNIVATLVEKEDQEPEHYQVKGIVSGLNTGNRTFSINNLTINYNNISDPPGIANGASVNVEGILNAPDELTATEIHVEDAQGTRGHDLSLEGIVTKFTSLSDFEVNGQPVLTTGQTQFSGDPASIALDVKVEVNGAVNSNGVLVAREVEIEDTDIED
jgi:hypothetical protein